MLVKRLSKRLRPYRRQPSIIPYHKREFYDYLLEIQQFGNNEDAWLLTQRTFRKILNHRALIKKRHFRRIK
jgi:hypothetical protein